jgi:hypothetical protein
VKTTAKQQAEMREAIGDHDCMERDLLDDLDELRECLRLMYEDTTRFDDDNDRALQARVAAALREPNDRD